MLPSAPDLKKERAFPCTSFRKKKLLNFKRESTRYPDLLNRKYSAVPVPFCSSRFFPRLLGKELTCRARLPYA